mmetsp:Transcript_31142/g.85324  ORF Transcript_31142/g.85324 Transcript_31142/m.85324 type:complete len:256 (-) Transcript_31142:101-868(-)
MGGGGPRSFERRGTSTAAAGAAFGVPSFPATGDAAPRIPQGTSTWRFGPRAWRHPTPCTRRHVASVGDASAARGPSHGRGHDGCARSGLWRRDGQNPFAEPSGPSASSFGISVVLARATATGAAEFSFPGCSDEVAAIPLRQREAAPFSWPWRPRSIARGVGTTPGAHGGAVGCIQRGTGGWPWNTHHLAQSGDERPAVTHGHGRHQRPWRRFAHSHAASGGRFHGCGAWPPLTGPLTCVLARGPNNNAPGALAN